MAPAQASGESEQIILYRQLMRNRGLPVRIAFGVPSFVSENKCAASYSSHSMGRMEKNQTARRVLQREFGSVS